MSGWDGPLPMTAVVQTPEMQLPVFTASQVLRRTCFAARSYGFTMKWFLLLLCKIRLDAFPLEWAWDTDC